MNELIKGLKEDTITAIVSNHYPLDEENKKLEFTYAKFGASGIETVFPALNTYLKGKLDLETIVRKLSYGSREILNLSQPIIKEGEQADMTLFDAEAAWKYSQTKSLSKNNPFLVQEFTGKVIGTIVNGKVFVNG
jgi:dihydroorotase